MKLGLGAREKQKQDPNQVGLAPKPVLQSVFGAASLDYFYRLDSYQDPPVILGHEDCFLSW